MNFVLACITIKTFHCIFPFFCINNCKSCLFYFRDCDTLTHLLKASLGTGILAMPIAFKSSGLSFGIFCTILVALVCTHCSYIVVSIDTIYYITYVLSVVLLYLHATLYLLFLSVLKPFPFQCTVYDLQIFIRFIRMQIKPV